MKLSPPELQRLSALLDEALDLSDSERERWFDALQGEALGLAPTLRELLSRQARRETGELIDRAPAFTAPTEERPSGSLVAGETIGPYRLQRLLGQGGMGEVWLAERVDGYLKRPVALKLPTLSTRSQVLVQRFARERDILGALAHPHIARLYDAGVASDGQPYLALEYVEGRPITTYCDELKLDAPQRIGLLRQVIQAVQFAHANLVVHRDVKPSNVLVTSDGHAMLLDFGIAKLLHESQTVAQETELTLVGGRALTLAYAAPEQVLGAPVSIAADVHGLGVLLYEMLAGCRPFIADSPARLEQAVLHDEPARPSTRAGGAMTTLPRSLRADIDTIVLKALKKAPGDRYATVEALGDDLDRLLRGEPVRAQRDSTWYRLRKFVIRYRWPVSAAAAVSMLVLGSGAVAIWQASLARQQSAVATEKAEVARREALRATAVQDFLLTIFQANSAAHKDAQRAQQTTARELLDIGTERIGSALQDAPEARMQVLKTLSDLHFELGLRSRAKELQKQAFELARSAFGPRDERFARMAIDLAHRLTETTDRQDAVAYMEQADAALRASGQADGVDRAALLFELSAYYQYEDLAKAIQTGAAAVEAFERRGADDPRLVNALRGLARQHQIRGDFVQSERLFRAALAAAARQGGSHVNAPAELSHVLFENGQPDEAQRYARQALADAIGAHGADHRWTLVLMIRLSNMLALLAQSEEADRLRQRVEAALAVQRPEYDAQFRADMAGYIGLPLLRRGRPDLYEPLMRQDGDDLAAHFPRSGALARSLVLVADAWIALGRYDEAAKAIANAQEIWRGFTHGAEASSVEFDMVAASLALATGRAREARQLLVEGQQRWEPKGLSSLNWRWRFEGRLAQAELASGDAGAAVQRAAATLVAMKGRLGSAALPALEADLLLVRGMAQQAAGNLEAASGDLERAVQLRQQHDDVYSLWLAQAQVAHGACLVALNRKPQARALWEAARRIHAQHREVAPHLAKPLEQLHLALGR